MKKSKLRAVGVRFARGCRSVYTYSIAASVKVHLGMEVVIHDKEFGPGVAWVVTLDPVMPHGYSRLEDLSRIAGVVTLLGDPK